MYIKPHINHCDCLFLSVAEEEIQKMYNMNPLMLKIQCHAQKTKLFTDTKLITFWHFL